MTRTPVLALAAGLLICALSACSGNSGSTASGLPHNGVTSTSARASVHATPTTEESDDTADPTSSADETTTATPDAASATLCKDFRNMDPAAAMTLIATILREHPDSKFEANPSAAIATAKLACTSASYADSTVASAAGLTP